MGLSSYWSVRLYIIGRDSEIARTETLCPVGGNSDSRFLWRFTILEWTLHYLPEPGFSGLVDLQDYAPDVSKCHW